MIDSAKDHGDVRDPWRQVIPDEDKGIVVYRNDQPGCGCYVFGKNQLSDRAICGRRTETFGVEVLQMELQFFVFPEFIRNGIRYFVSPGKPLMVRLNHKDPTGFSGPKLSLILLRVPGCGPHRTYTRYDQVTAEKPLGDPVHERRYCPSPLWDDG
ncbi:MAG: hypothetical protein BWY82_00154 [Verrucomicrobia bacterium ADurb.Bin474]|nr:MAG: hypothetical protein BWY82_00154 [Verrucomicrobia bacterium ADurb.Bin474]